MEEEEKENGLELWICEPVMNKSQSTRFRNYDDAENLNVGGWGTGGRLCKGIAGKIWREEDDGEDWLV